jgi:hypothetical protein
MSAEHFSEEMIRSALGEAVEIVGSGNDCPPPERLVRSGRGELEPREEQEVVLHLAGCTACAAAWRIAREVAGKRAATIRPFARRKPRVSRPWIGLAAAAALLVVVIGGGILVFSPERTTAPVYREQQEEILRSLVPEDRPLPREECVLRWAPAADGATYDVLVTDERMRTLARGNGIDLPEFRVPEEALKELRPGTRLYWQVSAHLPDGRRLESPTFIVSLE